MKDTKEKILKVAALEFSKKGYRDTTIRDICKKANVNIASINYHFNGKQALYKSAVDYLYNKDSNSRRVSNTDYESDAVWENELYQFILDLVERITDISPHRACLVKIFNREALEPSELFSVFFHDYFEHYIDELRKIISYKLNPGISEEEIYIIIFSIISQSLFYQQNKILVEKVSNKNDLMITTGNIAKNITEQVVGLLRKREQEYRKFVQ